MVSGQMNGNAARNLPQEAPRPQRRAVRQPEARTRPAPRHALKRTGAVLLVLAFFALFATVVTRFAAIEEINAQLDTLKTDLKSAQLETEQLRRQASMGLNLGEVEYRAGTELNMEMPGKDDEVFVTLPEATKAPAAEPEDKTEFKGVFDLLLGLLD